MRFPYVEAIVRGSVASAFAVPLWPPFVATLLFPLLYYPTRGSSWLVGRI